MSKDNVVKLAVSNPIITHQQLADQQFEPVADFVNISDSLEKQRSHAAKMQRFEITLRMAIALLGKTKAELIEGVKNMEGADELLREFSEASDLAKELASMISSAECRVACALANVCDE
jgi:hypothetical protein